MIPGVSGQAGPCWGLECSRLSCSLPGGGFSQKWEQALKWKSLLTRYLSVTSLLSVLAWQLPALRLARAGVMAEEKVPSPLGTQDLVCDLLKVKSFLAYYFTCVIQELRESTLLRFTISLHRLCILNLP